MRFKRLQKEPRFSPFVEAAFCNSIMEGDEIAIISEEGGVSETPKNDEEVVDDQIDEISNSEESMDDEEEYIKASRYEFPLSKDNFIFDFKDVEPEDDDDENDNLDENEDNDENEEEEEEENEKDGMEEEGVVEEEMTEQQRVADRVWADL